MKTGAAFGDIRGDGKRRSSQLTRQVKEVYPWKFFRQIKDHENKLISFLPNLEFFIACNHERVLREYPVLSVQ